MAPRGPDLPDSLGGALVRLGLRGGHGPESLDRFVEACEAVQGLGLGKEGVDPVAGHALPDEVSCDGHCHETYEPCKGEGQARVQFTAAGEEDEDGDGKVGTARGE